MKNLFYKLSVILGTLGFICAAIYAVIGIKQAFNSMGALKGIMTGKHKIFG